MYSSNQPLVEKALPGGPSFATRWKRRILKALGGWWAWEVISASTSVTATIVLAVVLSQLDGQPQLSWKIGPTELTPNTLVAALSTVIRAALLLAVAGALHQCAWNHFAELPRGGSPPGQPLEDVEVFGEAAANSWNSFLLIWRTKGRHIAALGSLLVILTLAFDTFAQQVLTISIEDGVPTTAAASDLRPEDVLPRAKTFNMLTGSAADIHASHTTDSTVAVISGVINNNASLPGAVCPTGRCTWPRTPTLGICSSCVDMRDQLQTFVNGTNTTYSLPSPNLGSPIGVSLSFNLGQGPHSDAISDAFTINTIADTDSMSADGTSRRNIVHLYALGLSPVTFQELEKLAPVGLSIDSQQLDSWMVAYDCSLYLCLQTSSARVEAGSLDQHVDAESWDQISRSDVVGSNSTYSFADAPSSMGIADAKTYTLDGQSVTILATSLQLFHKTLSMTVDNEFLGSGGVNGDSRPIVSIGDAGPVADISDFFNNVFFNASNSTTTMSNAMQGISRSLTNYLRTSFLAAPDPAFAPTVFRTQSTVRVRWGWLAYPIMLVVAGLLFLALTILQTRNRQVRPWKGHRIPLLLATVDRSVHTAADGCWDTWHGLSDRISEMRLQLDFDEQSGIAFSHVGRSFSNLSTSQLRHRSVSSRSVRSEEGAFF